MKKCLFFLLFLSFSAHFFSQTVPPNTRLIQLNTKKGSVLSLVELSDNYAYHVGTFNSSEIGIDGISGNSIGIDDMYILKSNASNGSNVWFKTFNAGNKGVITPRSVYVDSNDNLYVFAQFRGTVTVGTKTISSVNASDALLMKIDNNGSAIWVNYLENAYNPLYKTKCVTDAIDTYFVYGKDHLVRIDDITGNIIYNKIYNGVELKSVAINQQNVFVAGATVSSFAILGEEIITDSNVGFVVKGSKNADFNSSIKTKPNDSGLAFSDISDIAFTNDNNLLISGFYMNKAINILTENSTISFTYNPNTEYVNNSLYHFVAKINANLDSVSFFRSSSPIAKNETYNIRTDYFSSKLLPSGTNSNFRDILYINDRYKSTVSFTNTNTSTTTFTRVNLPEYTLVTSNDTNGNFLQSSQPLHYGLRMSASANNFSQINNEVRIFKTNVFNIQNSNLVWTKQKTSSIGGTLSKVFIKHLNSEKDNLFVTSLVEGKATFFGTEINNNVNSYSRCIARLGADGLPKWIAKFDYIQNTNISDNYAQNYVTTDKNDNFYIVIRRADELNSKFTDAFGTVITFSQFLSSSNSALIKLDKNGKYLWSKEISGINLGGIVVDSNENIFLTCSGGNLYVDGINNNPSGLYPFSILKFDITGNLVYSKAFQYGMSSAYSLLPVLDAENNLYIFSEPFYNQDNNTYIFGNISIPANEDFADLIMVKFDSSGNPVFGKNFYENLPANSSGYAFPSDVRFDGENFIIMGNYYNWNSVATNYNGLDMVSIPKVYTEESFITFIAKVNPNGSVVWQKPIHSNSNSGTGSYTNIGLDENKNIYMNWFVKDKIYVSGIEYNFDANVGNKIFAKFDTNGNLQYNKVVDVNQSSYPMIDVIDEDKINISALTFSNSILNYPVNYNRASSLYIATFGNLSQKYLTPIKDYLTLSEIAISNNPDNANTFSFDLVNNTDWNAASDQTWLNLSFLSLVEKNNFKNSILGSGDAKIIISADTNNSGANRSGSILLNGTGVNSKTIIVTQTFVLSTGETKNIVTTLYPNPTSDVLNIETKQIISKIEIFDLSGKLVKSENGKDKKVSVSNLTKGMYLIKLYTENGVVNSKFIKK